MKIKGKQIADSTIGQNNLGITTESVLNDTDVTTKEYVELAIESGLTSLSYSSSDLNMAANNTTIGVESLATNTGITDTPQGGVRVYVNGVEANVGTHNGCYCAFTGDSGTSYRSLGQEEQGDELYWNTGPATAPYQLTTDDEIDFIYLIIDPLV